MTARGAAATPTLTQAHAADLAARWAAIIRGYAPRGEETLEELVALRSVAGRRRGPRRVRDLRGRVDTISRVLVPPFGRHRARPVAP